MTITEAWKSAERTCFTQLVQHTGSREGANAFQGYLPEDRDSWMFTSGGNAASFQMSRVMGDNATWCALSFSAKVVCRFINRDDCLAFAGKVFQMLDDTTNMKEKGNVLRLHLIDMPSEPTPLELDDNVLIWLMEIPMEMTFSTSTEF